MEDRHTISEPRLKVVAADTAPTNIDSATNVNSSTEEIHTLEWEVDILRDSIVVDTIVINSSTLPPRKNKKNGKIVWCLPDTDAKLPSFGSEERRRIMEIFRDRRKLRKKSTRSSTANANSALATSTNNTQQIHAAAEYNICLQSNSCQPKSSKDAENGSEPIVFPHDAVPSTRVHAAISTTTLTCPPPPGFAAANDSTSSPKVARCDQSAEVTPSHPPPPGFDYAHLPSYEIKTDDSPQQRPSFSTGLSPKYICYVPPSTTSSTAAPSNISMTLPKLLAKLFLELYYPVFTTATPETVESSSSVEDGLHQQTLLIASLLPYYTATFQKSTSINGVHSVVSGDIVALVKQMQFLLEAIPGGLYIRSVVAQDLKEGGVLIMIAGTTVSVPAAGVSDSSSSSGFFSHAVTLIPMRGIPVIASTISSEENPTESTQMILGYQIHNDAFMLLS